MRPRIFLTLALLAVPHIAVALDMCGAMEKCSAIEDDAERLDCFDQVHRLFEGDCSTAAASDPDGVPDDAGGHVDPLSGWRITEEKNPLDDSPTVTLAKLAENDGSGASSSVTLLLRCKSGEADAYISWGDYLGAGGTRYHDLADALERGFTDVTCRFGSSPARDGRWPASTDMRATFAPDPATFIYDLMEVDKFVARTTPYNASPVTAVFDVSGLEGVVQPLLDACHLDPAKREVVETGPDPYVESVTMTLDTSDGLRACSALASEGGAPDPLPLRVIIEADGTVFKAWSLTTGFPGSDKLNDCIAEAIGSISFEAPKDGRKIVNYEWRRESESE